MAGSDENRFLPLPQRPSGTIGRLFGWTMERLNEHAYRKALAALSPCDGEAFLEIGFGTGRFIEKLLGSGPASRVCGIDPTETMVEVAQGRRIVRQNQARVDIRRGEACPLPWPDRTFDAVVAIHSFQFWHDPSAAMAEIRRVLVPGGRLLLVLRDHSSRAPDWLPNQISRSGHEVDGTRALVLQAGFFPSTFSGAGSSVILGGTLPGP
jgi:SAM-dependent methyltransferase